LKTHEKTPENTISIEKWASFTLPADQMARLTGIAPRTLTQRATEGYFPKPKYGQYSVIATFQGLLKYQTERGDEHGGGQLSHQRARLTRNKADIS